MQILMIPVPGPGPTSVRVEQSLLTVNQTAYPLSELPLTGPVRLAGEIVVVEYGQDGALASCQIGENHEVRFVTVTEAPTLSLPPEPEPEPEPEPDAEAQEEPAAESDSGPAAEGEASVEV